MQRKLFNLADANRGKSSGLRAEVADDTTTVFVYDVIDSWWGVSAADFTRELAAITTPKVVLRVNSPGGDVFEARAIVFEGSDDYHHRINDPVLGIDENCILVIRGAGPIGWPGSAEVVNMQPPDYLIQRGITALPTLGDGRQSGTSDSPSILNASPESAVGGGLSWLRTGDTIRIDLKAGRCDALVDEAEIARRRGGPPPPVPPSNTPWEELYREKTGQLADGAVLEFAVPYRGIAARTPRHNH